jgi:hypothetical protein
MLVMAVLLIMVLVVADVRTFKRSNHGGNGGDDGVGLEGAWLCVARLRPLRFCWGSLAAMAVGGCRVCW